MAEDAISEAPHAGVVHMMLVVDVALMRGVVMLRPVNMYVCMCVCVCVHMMLVVDVALMRGVVMLRPVVVRVYVYVCMCVYVCMWW